MTHSVLRQGTQILTRRYGSGWSVAGAPHNCPAFKQSNATDGALGYLPCNNLRISVQHIVVRTCREDKAEDEERCSRHAATCGRRSAGEAHYEETYQTGRVK